MCLSLMVGQGLGPRPGGEQIPLVQHGQVSFMNPTTNLSLSNVMGGTWTWMCSDDLATPSLTTATGYALNPAILPHIMETQVLAPLR